jgi:hypothetical protein
VHSKQKALSAGMHAIPERLVALPVQEDASCLSQEKSSKLHFTQNLSISQIKKKNKFRLFFPPFVTGLFTQWDFFVRNNDIIFIGVDRNIWVIVWEIKACHRRKSKIWKTGDRIRMGQAGCKKRMEEFV